MAASRLRRTVRYVLAVFWLCAVGFLFANMQAKGVAEQLSRSSDRVRVEINSEQMVFTPTVDTSGVGLFFFPGALVDADAYIPLAREVAEFGFKVVIQKLPWRMALLASHRELLFDLTRQLIINEQTSRHWVVGGHSKGGALAAEFAAGNASLLSGLLLIGTTHPRERAMSQLTIDVVKVSGSRDGLASPEEVEQFRYLLPTGAEFIQVEGGNHAQFAWYGWQLGDKSATISRSDQHKELVHATLTQLTRVSANNPRE
ncbi:MAG: putative alpha/beta-hydrolase family hydrolase [Rhodothermales bacterium]|jgi:predicted alpha/beta-hydrolase family hydrolase